MDLVPVICSVANPDPVSGAFLTPGSGIRDEQPESYFLELRNHCFGFLGLKYLNSLMRIRDAGIRDGDSSDRDGKKSDPGSGIKHPGSATLVT